MKKPSTAAFLQKYYSTVRCVVELVLSMFLLPQIMHRTWVLQYVRSSAVKFCRVSRTPPVLCIGFSQVAALLSRYLEYVGGKEDDGNAKIIQDSLQVSSTRVVNVLPCALFLSG